MRTRDYGKRNFKASREVLCLPLLTILLIFPFWGFSNEILEEANASYRQGEQGVTYQERKRAFNQALFLYHSLENQIPPLGAPLDLMIGDTYFQFRQYPWAILYYQRALKKDPNNILTLSRLGKAEEKLHLPSSFPSVEQQGLRRVISLAQRSQWLFWVIFVTFLVCSYAIWVPSWLARTAAYGSAFFLLFLIGNALFAYYFTPLEGVLVQATVFYRAPDKNQPLLTHFPLREGSKVRILQMRPDGEWLKIESSAGSMGYIPAKTLRPI